MIDETWRGPDGEVTLAQVAHDEFVVLDERGQIEVSADRLEPDGWGGIELVHAFKTADEAREALADEGFVKA